jgi:hypothetical protein
MTQVEIDLVQNFVELVTKFTDVALSDPLSAVLITVGGLLTAFSVAVFGVLSGGAAVAYVQRLFE